MPPKKEGEATIKPPEGNQSGNRPLSPIRFDIPPTQSFSYIGMAASSVATLLGIPSAVLQLPKDDARKESSATSNHQGSPSQKLIGALICPRCNGRICGRGLTCTPGSPSISSSPIPTVDSSNLRVDGGVMNSSNHSWKRCLLMVIVLAVLYFLSLWESGDLAVMMKLFAN
jgi:hypothetical protein